MSCHFFWAYVSWQCVNSSAIQLQTPKRKSKASALFLTIKKQGSDISPQPRFLPSLKALGVSLDIWLLSHQAPHFPRINFHPLGASSRVTLTGDPLDPDPKVKPCFNVKNRVHQTITVFIARPTFEERSPNSLAVFEHHHTVPTGFVLPTLEGSKDCHHLKLLDDSALPFGHHSINDVLVNLGAEEGQLLPRHVDDCSAKTTIGRDVK